MERDAHHAQGRRAMPHGDGAAGSRGLCLEGGAAGGRHHAQRREAARGCAQPSGWRNGIRRRSSAADIRRCGDCDDYHFLLPPCQFQEVRHHFRLHDITGADAAGSLAGTRTDEPHAGIDLCDGLHYAHGNDHAQRDTDIRARQRPCQKVRGEPSEARRSE